MNIIIVGGGLVGSTLAEKLSGEGHDITLIEGDAVQARELSDRLDAHVIEGNGATASMLRRAGVEQAGLLLGTTNSDDANMVVGMLGTQLFNVPQVVVRLRAPSYSEGFSLLNREHPSEYVCVNPDAAAVERIFSLLEVPGALDVVSFMDNDLVVAGFRIAASSDFSGLQVVHVQLLFAGTPTLVVAIRRADNRWVIPSGQDEIIAGDLVYFAIARTDLDNVLSLLGEEREQRQHIMVAGAGRVGLELAKRLEDVDAKVVLIEEDPDRARKAAEVLKHSLVICGNVTDQTVLEEEEIERVSTFVAASSDNENNLVAGLLAKRLGASRAFALLDNPALVHLIGDVGIDAVISPRLLAIGLILQQIGGRNVHSYAALLEDEVEVMEVDAVSGSKLTSGKLANIGLPRGVIVAALRRGEKLLVPRGGDRVEPGDRALIISSTESASKVSEYVGS